jgi:hypothetical protein
MGSRQSGQRRRTRPASHAAQMQRCAQGSSSTRTCAFQHTAHCVAGASWSSGCQAAEAAAAAAVAAAAVAAASGRITSVGAAPSAAPAAPPTPAAAAPATAAPSASKTTKRNACRKRAASEPRATACPRRHAAAPRLARATSATHHGLLESDVARTEAQLASRAQRHGAAARRAYSIHPRAVRAVVNEEPGARPSAGDAQVRAADCAFAPCGRRQAQGWRVSGGPARPAQRQRCPAAAPRRAAAAAAGRAACAAERCNAT